MACYAPSWSDSNSLTARRWSVPGSPPPRGSEPAGSCTAAEALAWFTPGAPPDQPVIGYTPSARATTWLRVRPDHSVETVHTAEDVLAEAYEMVLFDGERELRWLRTPDGRSTAVAVGEGPSLPSGDVVTGDPAPRRGSVRTRLLAGVPRPHATPGWTTLHSGRYAAAHLPLSVADSTLLVVIDAVEYLTEDDHGNVDVADTRTVRLRAVSPELSVLKRYASRTARTT